jgi:hypothetical protein
MHPIPGGVALAMITLSMLGAPAQGQGVESVRRGARIRLAMDGGRTTGILAERVRDTLWVRVDHSDTVRAVPLSRVRGLEVSRERRNNAGRMALAGLVIGSVPGVVSGATCDCGNRAAAVVLLGGITAGLGAAIGAALGATGHHDVWEMVPLAAAASVSPAIGGITLLRVSFR